VHLGSLVTASADLNSCSNGLHSRSRGVTGPTDERRSIASTVELTVRLALTTVPTVGNRSATVPTV
jgi:hypothetical protein